jgi:carboxylesterase type B
MDLWSHSVTLRPLRTPDISSHSDRCKDTVHVATPENSTFDLLSKSKRAHAASGQVHENQPRHCASNRASQFNNASGGPKTQSQCILQISRYNGWRLYSHHRWFRGGRSDGITPLTCFTANAVSNHRQVTSASIDESTYNNIKYLTVSSNVSINQRKKQQANASGYMYKKVQSNPRVAASNRKKEPKQLNRQRQC